MNTTYKWFVTSIIYILSFCGLGAQNLIPFDTYQSPIQNNFPDEISFCIVDLKYDGQSIKICEFGEGIESKFKGYDLLNTEGQLWSHLWDFLGSFKRPLWLVNKRLQQVNQKEVALQSFFSYKGYCTTSLQKLEKTSFFSKKIKSFKHRPGINHHAAILAIHTLGERSSVVRIFKIKYPQCLILGNATTNFVRNKDKTNLLFQNDPELMNYRPKFNLYDKKYSPSLATTIINELGCNTFVIKPTNASRGNGIIIVEKQNLDKTLNLILNKNGLDQYKDDPSYSYWRLDHNPMFIVEEFAQSKTIYVNQKPYDPTMRVIFVLCNDAGTMRIKFFDAYWKLPTHTLDECGTLTEKHKSHIGFHAPSSAKVSDEDFAHVTLHLCQLLPKLYLKMLQHRFN